jgi:DNA-binding transcriptional LysR family regulator
LVLIIGSAFEAETLVIKSPILEVPAIDVRLLRYFRAVAEAGSFRAGARRAGVSQPAVSQAVALLEEEIGAQLFERVSRRALLTREGSLLLEHARRLIAEFDDLPALLARSRGVVCGRLEIGTTDAASIHVLPKVYRTFRRRYPQVELSVRVEGTASLLRELEARSIELALLNLKVGSTETRLPEGGFEGRPLFREDLLFVVSARDSLASKRRVSLSDLADTPFLTFKSDSITRRAVETLFREHGATLRVAMEISSPEAIKKLVEVGLGASVLPSRSVQAEVQAGRLAILSVPEAKLARILGVAQDARRAASPAVQAFLGLCERIRNVL